MKATEKVTVDGVPHTYMRADVDEWLREHGREPLRYFADTIEARSVLVMGEVERWEVSAVAVGGYVIPLGWFRTLKAMEVLESEPQA